MITQTTEKYRMDMTEIMQKYSVSSDNGIEKGLLYCDVRAPEAELREGL